jgi:ATP/maltotriose-dependent transcriptional regulator MalT
MSGLYNAIPLIEMGRADRAREVLLAMSGGGPQLQTSRSGYAAACEVLVRAELALQNVGAAEEWAHRAELVVGDAELAAEAAHARRATAAVALARREPAIAAKIALAAASRADGAGALIEAGRCRIVGARALAESGQLERAMAELERAVEDLGHIGAGGYRAEAQKELRRLGRGMRRETVDATAHDGATSRPSASGEGPGSLTRSERAVVALVAEGLTNPEGAGRLYLSPHTVKRHLANAMAKLHVRSRRQLRAFSRGANGETELRDGAASGSGPSTTTDPPGAKAAGPTGTGTPECLDVPVLGDAGQPLVRWLT